MTRLWMLPDGVEELLPPSAWALEALRSRLLERYRHAGYDLVIPPMVEYLDALLTGVGSQVGEHTFKFTDPVSGRLLGLRADMTPQAARIAARHFSGADLVRLCYIGSVLRTRADVPGGSRAPMQVGCEIFGESGIEADLEVLGLMLDTLRLAGISGIHVGLGHVAVYHQLVAGLKLNAQDEAELFDILQRKSHPDFTDFSISHQFTPDVLNAFHALMDLNGDSTEVLEKLRCEPFREDRTVRSAAEELSRAVDDLACNHPNVRLHLDLADLRGYRYETGMVFAAFVPGYGHELARGGRYDGAGQEFGLARPASGFSADLNELLQTARETKQQDPA